MIFLRSLVYQVLFYGWTVILCVAYLPLLLTTRDIAQKAARIWLKVSLAMLGAIAGLRYRVVGLENLPDGPAIIASKHQSMFETMAFHQILADPVYVLKIELVRIPLFGWYLQKTGSISVDRKAGARALKSMLAQAREAVRQNRQIVIFPEGTRTRPGESAKYQPGVAMLYETLGVPVVPVALDSGRFWGRRSFAKRPGTVTIQFLPALPPGLDRRAFMQRLRHDIESASDRLAAGTD